MTLHEAAIYTIERFNLSESVEELKHEWNRMVAEIYEHSVALKPYAREYLTALKQHGTRLAVATSLPKALYEPALRKHDLTHLFDAFCSTDEVGCGKRQPDVFLLAAKRLSTEPARCVVYEDLLEAIMSAKQAGMRAYAVYDESSKATWDQITKIADGTIFDFREAYLPNSGV
jgi:HAD superfamily hydrolase (TIGR01509 family)